MTDLSQTQAEIQTLLNNVEGGQVGETVPTALTDTMSTGSEKSGFHPLGASSANSPSTDRSVMFTSTYNVIGSNLNYGHVVLTESNEMFFNVNIGGSLQTWLEAATVTGTQTFTNKTLTSPTITTPTITGATNFTGDLTLSSGNLFGTGQTLWFYGGVSGSPGFNMGIIGPDHATFARDLICYSGPLSGDLVLHYDYSGQVWDFQDQKIVTTGRVTAGELVISSGSAPASASATGVAGTIAWDADYIYTCVATDTWKRVALATW